MLLLFLFLCTTICESFNFSNWNEPLNKTIRRSDQKQETEYLYYETKPGQVARMVVWSDANETYPLLITFRDIDEIASYQIPYILENDTYTSFGRNLCPWNISEESSVLTVAFTGPPGVNFSITPELWDTYKISLGVPRQFDASPSAPAVFEFDMDNDTNRVVVQIDSESTMCAQTSVQRITCDAYDHLNDVPHVSLVQTMTKSSTIVVDRKYYTCFLVVVNVLGTDSVCLDHSGRQPAFEGKGNRTKSFTLRIDPYDEGDHGVLKLTLWTVGFTLLFTFLAWLSDRYKRRIDEAQQPVVNRVRDVWARVRERVRQSVLGDLTMRLGDCLNGCSGGCSCCGDGCCSCSCLQCCCGCFQKNEHADNELSVYDLARHPHKERAEMYNNYFRALFVVSLLVGANVTLLVFTFEDNFFQSGNLDKCWFNYRCTRAGLNHTSFNAMFSNITYLGAAFFVVMSSKLLSYEKKKRDQVRTEARPDVENGGGLTTQAGTDPERGSIAAPGPLNSGSADTVVAISTVENKSSGLTEAGVKKNTAAGSSKVKNTDTTASEASIATTNDSENPGAKKKDKSIAEDSAAVNDDSIKVDEPTVDDQTPLVAQAAVAEQDGNPAAIQNDVPNGVPFHTGMIYSEALALSNLGAMSAMYHNCPSRYNFPTDTCYMLMVALLEVAHIHHLRKPDAGFSFFVIYSGVGVMALVVIFKMVGVEHTTVAVIVKIVSVLIFLASLPLSAEMYLLAYTNFDYYRKQYRDRNGLPKKIGFWENLWEICQCSKPDINGAEISDSENDDAESIQIPDPLHSYWSYICNGFSCSSGPKITRLLFFLISCALNGVVFYFTISAGRDLLPKLILLFCIGQFALYFIFYVTMKIVLGEPHHSFVLIICMIADAVLWGWALYVFSNEEVSAWNQSPSASRELNKDCILWRYYDSHDKWHWLSSSALGLSFFILARIDENVADKRRDEIKVI